MKGSSYGLENEVSTALDLTGEFVKLGFGIWSFDCAQDDKIGNCGIVELCNCLIEKG
jgi:hypothetical protein